MTKSSIQPRDEQILEALIRYKYLNVQQIHYLFYPENQTANSVYYAMKKLLKMGLVDISSNKGGGKLRNHSVYFITGKGISTWCELYKIDSGRPEFKRITNPISAASQIAHRTSMIDFWIEFDLDILQFPNLEIRQFRNDFIRDENQVPATKISTTDSSINMIPDQVILLADHNTLDDNKKPVERLFFVEIDRGTVSVGGRYGSVTERSMTSKYLGYQKILTDGSWKEQLGTAAKAFGVLTVTTTAEHLDFIRGKSAAHINHPEIFFFNTHENIQKHGVIRANSWLGLHGSDGINILYGR